jgi:uncharacterized membrane protein YdjX (TVP38/TMEM64 family)
MNIAMFEKVLAGLSACFVPGLIGIIVYGFMGPKQKGNNKTFLQIVQLLLFVGVMGIIFTHLHLQSKFGWRY